ncbi:Histone-lysine N-methyltransferase EHMT1 [Metarhizium anisopliae]|nr:Histone-lysine N-methyltransferase EHMT1 [Metarhizium anisopliae]
MKDMKLQGHVEKFVCDHRSSYRNCYSLYRPDDPYLRKEDLRKEPPLALYYASFGGLAASYGGHDAVAQLLVDNGADVEAKDENGRMPLSWAAENWNGEATVKLLLEKGADIEPKDEDGRTPLWLAAEKGRKAIVKLYRQDKQTEPSMH